MQTINFVRKRRRELSKIEIQDQQNLKRSFYVIGAIIAVFLVILGARLGLGIMVSNTNRSINSLKQSINAKTQIEEQYVVFMKKVDILVDLFSQRKEKQEGIAYFSSLFDPAMGIRISQLSYSAETHTLDFTLRAPSVFALQEVFTTLRSANVRERYSSFSIQRLSRSGDGSYGLVINLPLPTRPAGEVVTDETLIQPLIDEFGEPIVPDDGTGSLEDGALPEETGATDVPPDLTPEEAI